MALLPAFGMPDDNPYNQNYSGNSAYAPSAPAPAPMQSLSQGAAPAPVPLGFLSDKTTPSPVQAPQPVLSGGQRGVLAAQRGLAAGGQVQASPDGLESGAQVLGAGLQGGLAGAAVGGPAGAAVGAGVGVVMGALNAWLGNRAARRAADKEEALKQEALRLQKEEIARDEHWKTLNHLDSLELARYQRKKFAMQQAVQESDKQRNSVLEMINGNSVLKDRFAKLGYV